MSVAPASRSRTSRPAGVFRLRTIPRLPRLTALKLGLSRPDAPGMTRVESPAGGSTLITSAPRSASPIGQYGPPITRVTSRTRRPSRARAGIGVPGILMHTIFETAGPVATLTFNRPEARNAITWAMYEALVDACERVDGDEAIRVLVLRGAGGKAFVAGTDISQFQTFKDRQDGLKYEERLDHVLDRLERVSKPTIAQVEGVAVGGGCAIALVCDLRVATPESSFGVPIARTLGNCLSGATYSRLVDLAGPSAVKDLMFTGRLLRPAPARPLRPVKRRGPPHAPPAPLPRPARGIRPSAPLTIRATKEMIRRVLENRRLARGDDADLVELCYTSDDFHEGVEAFLAKRKPRWSGR